MPVLLQAVESDDDKEAVSVAVTAAAEIVRGCGAPACARHLPALIAAIGKVGPLLPPFLLSARAVRPGASQRSQV